MLRKKIFSPWMLSLFVLLLAATALAQTTASIQGTVSDQSGAAIVGAKVTVKNTALGIERTTQTSSSGGYEVPALPPGTYSVQVQMTGFETQLAKEVVLEVSKNSVQNFGLKVASTSEVVTVEATAPVIESTTITVGQTINQRTVQDIPLNGRHFVDLALLIPGSVTPPQNGFLSAPLRGQGMFQFNTAGNREDSVNFMINGINLNDMVQNQVTFQPTINTVSEFKVDNSTYSAESGRNSGAIVNIATRSGTDQFHGEAYEFLRNDWFDARNAFNTVSTGPIAPFKRNQFGGDLGGPIVKGKTFFFASYEGLRQRQGLTLTSNVFTEAQRTAIQTSGNALPINLMSLVPHPNTISGSGGVLNAFTGSATAPVDIDQGTMDINHNFSEVDHLHGYYVYQRDLRQETGATGGAVLPGWGDTRDGHRQVLTLGETHVFSANVVNEARLGANRIHLTFTPNNLTDPNSIGLGSALGPNLQFMPVIVIQDQGVFTIGSERNFPQGRGDTMFVVSDTLSWVRGRHSFKFGGELRDFRNNNFNNDPGTLVFKNTLGATNSFQSAQVLTAARTLGNVASRINQGALDFFGTDSWKISSSLTLELGLRYAWNMTPSEAQDRFSTVVPAAGGGTIITPASEPYGQNAKNFEPRVGFALDVFHNSKTVLRGAYAYQVDQPITGIITALTSNPPFALPINVTVQTGTPIATLGTNFNPAATGKNLALTLIDPNFKNADLQSWNLNVQQQIGRDTSLMVGYFGSKGTHLEIDRNINQFPVLGTASSRPFQVISASSAIQPGATLANTMTERTSDSNSTYNALWVTANKRMSHGLQLNASYTWSHSIDDVSRTNNGFVVQDSTNIFGSKGSSDFDARHRFVVNAIYDLPFKGNRIKSGWTLATIGTLQSGNPVNIVLTSSAITGVGNTVFPNLIGPLTVTGNPLGPWIVPSSTPTDGTGVAHNSYSGVFTTPITNAFGNLGRNSIIGPSFKNLDLSVIKNTKIMERLNVQFRADAFDLTNHPNYGQPARAYNPRTINGVPNVDDTFGIISSTRFPTGDSGSSRQLQLALKLQF
jgi:hypothetical protein